VCEIRSILFCPDFRDGWMPHTCTVVMIIIKVWNWLCETLCENYFTESFVCVGDSDSPIPHIQRRVNVTHMHVSDRYNVKRVKLIMWKFMKKLLTAGFCMCGRFRFWHRTSRGGWMSHTCMPRMSKMLSVSILIMGSIIWGSLYRVVKWIWEVQPRLLCRVSRGGWMSHRLRPT
jgi:hypothetical protein